MIMFKNKQEFDIAKSRLDTLINEATAKGMLEPDMDNEYTREIGIISAEMAEYEDKVLKLTTLGSKTAMASVEKCSYHVTMPVVLHDSVAQRAMKLGRSISDYISEIMARELNVVY